MTGEQKKMNYPFLKSIRLNKPLLDLWDPVYLRKCLQYKDLIEKNLETWMNELLKKKGL